MLLNYGWIVDSKRTVREEELRVPYSFNVPLYMFGRDYVARVNVDLSKQSDIQLIDLQVLIDVLSKDSKYLYRIFTDEMHYTPFSDFIVARHIFMNLLGNKTVCDFIAGCGVPAMEKVDAQFAPKVSWGMDFVGYGFPRDGGNSLRLSNVSMVNIKQDADDCLSGWCVYSPLDKEKEAVLSFDADVNADRGIVAFFPRIYSNEGFVYFDMYEDGQWKECAKLISYDGSSIWSPVEARYGCDINLFKSKVAHVRIRMLGKAQVFHKDGNVLFARQK